ncbi:MAG: hypothetical protein GQ535_13865, partial [Rhodobacteraceae bacterium]|nr:hypothetical protein [Paracoccaceae bacterium]
PTDLWRYVSEGHNGIDLSAKTIQFLLVRQAMVEQSISLKSEFSETSLLLEF